MIQNLLSSSSTHAQMLRYFVVASVGLAVDFATVILTKELFDFHYLVAACLGFILGLVITYILSNMVVFGAPKGNKAAVFVLFAIIGIVGLGILSLLMWLLTGQLGVNYIASKALATGVVFMWNFFARRLLFKKEALNLPYEL